MPRALQLRQEKRAVNARSASSWSTVASTRFVFSLTDSRFCESQDHLQLVVVGLLVMLALVGALIAWLLLGSSSAASASSSANDPAIAGQRDKGFATSYTTAPTAKHCKARTSTSLHAAVNETTSSTPKTTTVRSASASTDSPGTTTTPIASSSSAASTAATSTGTAKPDVASAGKPRKKGIGYNNVDFANGLANVCWAYNWAPSPGGQLDSGIQYWPMLSVSYTHALGSDADVDPKKTDGAKSRFLAGTQPPKQPSRQERQSFSGQYWHLFASLPLTKAVTASTNQT